jgi:hypothetical protein
VNGWNGGVLEAVGDEKRIKVSSGGLAYELDALLDPKERKKEKTSLLTHHGDVGLY